MTDRHRTGRKPAPEYEAGDVAPHADTPAAQESLLEKFTAHYPAWAKDLARKYFTKTLTQFILYGNVRDLVPTKNVEGDLTYVPLRGFLTDDLFSARDIVIFYDRSAGIHFADKESQKDFNRALSGFDTIFGTDYVQKLPKDPVRVFSVLENYFRTRLADGKRIACIIDYAETIVPMAEASMYSAEDRSALVFLQKWAHDPLFLAGDFTLCLITENLTDLNQQLVQSPYTAEIQIIMPDEPARRTFAHWYVNGQEAVFERHSDVHIDAIAANTAGLGYIQLRTILADVIENRTELTFDVLSQMKKEFIEAEAYGMLEFVETDYTLDMVAGHAEAKGHLRQAAQALKAGRPDVMPMGYLVSGPVGTGKTFMITCFAGEIGIPMVKLKNFRSQWQGVTEGNLEKILHLLEAMTPVAVMIDEADAALGDRDVEGDSGVSRRVFGQFASFMSMPGHRGRIIFFLVTARPDLMPVDLKRQGRAEEHIALFYPNTRVEREELLNVMMRRTGVKLPMDQIPDALLNGSKTFSGADMEALFTRAKFRAAADPGSSNGKVATNGNGEQAGGATNGDGEQIGAPARRSGEQIGAAAGGSGAEAAGVTSEILQEVVEDFIPPTYPEEVELQTLAAVLECTSQALLPEQYRSMDRETIVKRIQNLKRFV